jgi:hypothetical protein
MIKNSPSSAAFAEPEMKPIPATQEQSKVKNTFNQKWLML